MLIDSHGRKVSYLRLSITDRCNLRCLYCRPQSEWTFMPHEQILSFEEMAELVDVGKRGMEKLNSLIPEKSLELLATLSGGDARTMLNLVEFAAGLEEKDLEPDQLKTRLPEIVLRGDREGDSHYELASALIKSIRGSDPDAALYYLASLVETGEDPRFICRRLILSAAEDVGLGDPMALPLAVSCEQAVERIGMPAGWIPMAETNVHLARENGVDVRFIEFMPIGYQSRWSRENYWPAEDIIAEVEKLVPLEEVLEASRNSGPARMYGISGGSGRIGVISAVSNHFCESCNRFRVTSDGKLRTCLFSDREYDVRSILRDPGHTMQDLLDLFARANAEKPLGYRLLQDREHNQVCDRAMTAIGG